MLILTAYLYNTHVHIKSLPLKRAAILLFIQGVVLLFLGQPAICTCGYIKLWECAILSSGMSQHLSDWYTFSHIIHGFVFYFFLWRFFPKIPISQKLLFALGIEVAWEIAENTPWVINAYREQALAQGYVGDSIINSIFDSLFMMLGFFAAWKLPAKITVATTVFLELWVGYAIHDNLTLNILNFIYQFDFIRRWQAGG